jgi:hypothetical protein
MMDNSLEFWFRKLTPDSPPIGRIICLAEREDVYHVEVRMRGQWFSATTDYGVRFTIDPGHLLMTGGSPALGPDPEYWDVVAVPELVSDDNWCSLEVGAGYDYFGALNSAIGVHIRNPYKWFCSEIAAEVASRCGITGLDPLPDPSVLRGQLMRHVGMLQGEPIIPVGLAFGDADSAYLQSLVDSRTIDPDTAQKVMARIAG